MRFEIWRKQVFYLGVTASQPEVREHIFRYDMLIPWPATSEQRQRIIDSARRVLDVNGTEILGHWRGVIVYH